jgi:pilus assembly protein CpaE
LILVVDPSERFFDTVKGLLPNAPDDPAHLRSLPELEKRLEEDQDTVGALLLGPRLDVDSALDLAGKLETRRVPAGIVLTSHEVTPELLRAALRAGVQDVIEWPCTSQQLEESLGIALEYSRQAQGPRATPSAAEENDHKIISVFSTKGGSGKSFVASNVAILLANATKEPVALVDLNLQSGDLAIMLQLLPAWTISDAAEGIERLDADALRAYMTEHRSGVRLLAAPVEPSMADSITPAAVQHILRILRQEYRYTIIDGPALFTDQMLAALDETTQCVLVTSLDVPSIKNLKLSLQTLSRLGFGRERIRLVLNRADTNVGLRLHEVEKALGTNVDVAVPSSREVPLSINQGTPLATTPGRKGKPTPVVAPLADLVEDLVESGGHAGTEVDPATGATDEGATASKRRGRSVFRRT